MCYFDQNQAIKRPQNIYEIISNVFGISEAKNSPKNSIYDQKWLFWTKRIILDYKLRYKWVEKSPKTGQYGHKTNI